MLAADEAEQIEHRSVVAIETCTLARITREDFRDAVASYPEVKEKLENVGQAELLDVLDLDNAVDKTELRELYDELVADQLCSALAAPKAAAKKGKLTATALPIFLEKLGAELSTTGVVAAMRHMDPAATGTYVRRVRN